MKTHRAWLPPLIWSIVVIAGVLLLMRVNETAREVISQTALTVFQVLTTPFILESVLALLGLCIVIAINHHRQKKEGDGWVYLEQKVPAPEAAHSDDPPHRHEAVVWQEKPAPFDQTAAELDVAEGYLDLGLAEDALRELATLPDEASGDIRAGLLRARALNMSGREDEALAVFDRAARQHASCTPVLAGAALSIALWLHDNKKPAAVSAPWLERCRCIDEATLNQLPAGHPFLRQPAG